jgi:hypothetical protein
MLCNFEKVVDGISKFINAEIYSGMNDLQEVVARIVISRIIGNEETIKNSLVSNSWIRTFGIIDGEGMIDIDALAKDLKREIGQKGKIEVSIPMFGTFKFVPEDVDTLYKYIAGEVIR